MKNFIQEGTRITYLNSGETAIESGAGVVVGGKLYVATGKILAGETGDLATVGVFELAKTTGQAFTQGAKLFWAADKLTTTVAGGVPVGVCWEAAGSSDVLAHVKLGDIGDTTGVASEVDALAEYVDIADSTATAVDAADPTMSEVNAAVDALAAKVDAKVSANHTAINAILTALKAAGLMTDTAE